MSDRDVFQPPERIETERLILRKARLSDAAILHDAYMTDPDVAKFTSWKPRTDVRQSEMWIAHCIKQWERAESFPFVIEYESEPIGMVGMHSMSDHISFAFVIAKPFWGKGIMPEALSALIDWALAQQCVNRVQIYFLADNHRSQRVIEKCGLEYEYTFAHPDNLGEPKDCKMYSKVR
ncbi:GNAT family N-acetyltransferase [Lentilitoribacter sp. Alg239-R112]|uniref:GNAT family N-acetyltransferase n=1 Tax=Lentilitoribacter sp. Alg239-R112 TaxID=2305987 RepID=UPI0013A695F6|nr:GNAT family N-acetyltransferase [Lentilitoribacter sp. Alg239-R112]